MGSTGDPEQKNHEHLQFLAHRRQFIRQCVDQFGLFVVLLLEWDGMGRDGD